MRTVKIFKGKQLEAFDQKLAVEADLDDEKRESLEDEPYLYSKCVTIPNQER